MVDVTDNIASADPTIAAALAARSAGELAGAVALWRQVLHARPDNWRAALELRRDLTGIGLYAEADPLFRRAAAHFPDAEWLAYFDSVYSFHHDHLDALMARARQVAGHRPGDLRAHRLLAEVAWQRRDLAGAESAFAACAALRPDQPGWEASRQLVLLQQRLASALAAAPPSGPQYAASFINLDRNTERRDAMQRHFSASAVPLHRLPGVDGSALPASLVRTLVRDPAQAGRGTLGCFLSHRAAWQAVLDRGLPWCLVLEDDVIPMLDLPARLGPLNLPNDAELCFVNDRLQPRRTAAEIAATPGFETVPLPQAMLGFPPDDNAPGADAYLLSAAGARRLLDWTAADGCDGDVDWRLLAYAMTDDAVAALPRHGHAWATLDRWLHSAGRADRLRAHVLFPALIRTAPVSSDREDGNRAGTAVQAETLPAAGPFCAA